MFFFMNERIAELLVRTGAFTDLDEPVILASGELGIYYINTESLVMDGGEWKSYGDDSQAMISHACEMCDEHPEFREVIDALKDGVAGRFIGGDVAVSGGQRRDWLFSGPVARSLGLPHVSCYKDGKLEVVLLDGSVVKPVHGSYERVFHVADLLTNGSSAYRLEKDVPKGWIPMVNSLGSEVNDLLVVVSRLQKGEENLDKRGVSVHSLVQVGREFLSAHSKDPGRAKDYFDNPSLWSESYIADHGVSALLPSFDPEGGKLDRARRFLQRYIHVLGQTGAYQQLEDAVKDRYAMSLDELFGGCC